MRYRFLVILIGLCLATTGIILPGIAQTEPARNVRKNTLNAQSIRFIENSLPSAIKQAKAGKKYIFVDCYADWCGPCRLLKSSTFLDKEVSTFFNAHFINVSMDMEKGEGIVLTDKWNVQEYPTLLILDTTGAVILRSTGFLEPKELMKFGKQGLHRKL